MTESFPVASYTGAWGCSVSLSCRSPLPTQPIGPFSSPSRPSSPSASCTGGGGPLSVVVGSMISSGLAYDLFAHQQLLQVSGDENFELLCLIWFNPMEQCCTFLFYNECLYAS